MAKGHVDQRILFGGKFVYLDGTVATFVHRYRFV